MCYNVMHYNHPKVKICICNFFSRVKDIIFLILRGGHVQLLRLHIWRNHCLVLSLLAFMLHMK